MDLFEELEPIIRRRRRMRKIDGRTIRGVKLALEAAQREEAQDNRYIEMLNSGLTYSEIGKQIGKSRQRATELVERAVVRRIMLKEFRAGKSERDIAFEWHNLYPRKSGEQVERKARQEIAAKVEQQPLRDDSGESI